MIEYSLARHRIGILNPSGTRSAPDHKNRGAVPCFCRVIEADPCPRDRAFEGVRDHRDGISQQILRWGFSGRVEAREGDWVEASLKNKQREGKSFDSRSASNS